MRRIKVILQVSEPDIKLDVRVVYRCNEMEALTTKVAQMAEILGSDVVTIRTPDRTRMIADKRKMICAALYGDGYSQHSIAKALGYADHTSVIHNLRAHSALFDTDPKYQEQFTLFINSLNSNL